MPISLVYDTTCCSSTGVCCAWTVPAGVYGVTFEIWGGGGGGGGGITSCDCCSATIGGGGGGYSMKSVAVNPGETYTVCAGNAGVATDGNYYGAPVGYCQNGCNGGTSFVTGPAFTRASLTFCATGGRGGCSQFTINCYGMCGCAGDYAGSGSPSSGGIGVGGDINYTGMPGSIFTDSASYAYGIVTMGGPAGGPGGGSGGILTSQWCCFTYATDGSYGTYQMNGSVPGGGGSGHRNGQTNPGACCTCTTTQSGRGGPGLVKITF